MADQLEDLEGVRHKEHDLATGVRVHVAEAGDPGGPPALLLHGWPQDWWIWRGVIPGLADRYRLICPDLRGFGRSGWPDDGDFHKQRLADDAVALLDVLGVERAHVLGHDWGAWAGLLLALGSPERVRSLLALSVLHPWQPRPVALRNSWRFLYQVPLATPWLGERLVRTDTFITRMIRSGWGEKSTWDGEAAARFEAILREPNRTRASHLMYRMFLQDEIGRAAGGGFADTRLTMPARLLIGEHDPLGSALAAGFDRHGDDAAFEVVPGAGHFLPEERPQVVIDRARELFGAAG